MMILTQQICWVMGVVVNPVVFRNGTVRVVVDGNAKHFVLELCWQIVLVIFAVRMIVDHSRCETLERPF